MTLKPHVFCLRVGLLCAKMFHEKSGTTNLPQTDIQTDTQIKPNQVNTSRRKKTTTSSTKVTDYLSLPLKLRPRGGIRNVYIILHTTYEYYLFISNTGQAMVKQRQCLQRGAEENGLHFALGNFTTTRGNIPKFMFQYLY